MVGFKVSEKTFIFANFMATLSGSVLAKNTDHGEPSHLRIRIRYTEVDTVYVFCIPPGRFFMHIYCM
jgi:hypothetical protein